MLWNGEDNVSVLGSKYIGLLLSNFVYIGYQASDQSGTINVPSALSAIILFKRRSIKEKSGNA